MQDATVERAGTGNRAAGHRGAIIGLGGVAVGAHLPGIRLHRSVRDRIDLVCAVDPAHAGEPVDGGTGLPTMHGLPVLPNVEALAEFAGSHGPIDFVDIATPSASHVALTRWALEQGLNVLCEKPVATSRADALELVRLARERGLVLAGCHQYRFNPVWQRVRRWIAAGVLGRWYLVEIAVYRTSADAGTDRAAVPWRARRDVSGGGILLDHGTHLLYTMLDIGGMPERLSAWTGRLLHRDYDVEDTAQVRLEYPDRIANLFLTWAARQRDTGVRILGEEGSITWTEGTLTLERGGERETHDFSSELAKSAYPGWFAELFRTFADTVDAGAGSELALAASDDVVSVATLLEGAYSSARSGAPVTLG